VKPIIISKKLRNLCNFDFLNQVISIGFYVVNDKLILKQHAMDLQIKNSMIRHSEWTRENKL